MRHVFNVKPVVAVEREGPLRAQIRGAAFHHLHHTGGVIHLHVIDPHVGFVLTCSRAPPQEFSSSAFSGALFLAGFGVIEGFAGVMHQHYTHLFGSRQFTEGKHLRRSLDVVVLVTYGVRLKERVNDEHIELPHFDVGKEVHHGRTVD
jgi:hypothetical protein